MSSDTLKKTADFLYVFAAIVLAMVLSAMPVLAQQAPAALQADTFGGVRMEASFTRALDAGQLDGRRFLDARAMQDFYAGRSGYSFWTGSSGLNSRGLELISLLQEAWTHGLNPAQYNLSKIERLLGSANASKRAALELTLTDAAVRYARDLSGMRIDPDAIQQRSEFWEQPTQAHDILTTISGAGDVAGALESFAPQDKLYIALRRELVKLAGAAERSYEHVLPLNMGKQYFFPGERGADVPKLRVRLGLPAASGTVYDDDLAQAVMTFQRQNDLEPDGIIGPKTLDLLNQSTEKKILQVVANLERLRWLDRELPKRYILVNTAQQRLWAVENGRVKHEMKVIVGKPWRRTKEFKAEITGIRFNPDWTVPPGIKRYDIWPKVQKDPGYLIEKGIEVIRGYGDEAVTLDPHSIDWKNLSLRELHDLRLVGIPGDTNPLGRVRVLMPNRYNMYLHDTDHPELFEKPERTYSSGCIRMERPKEIADFVLKHNHDWSRSMMDEIIGTVEKTEIDAEVRMPVYVIHQTTWLDTKGQVVFGADIYKRDKDLIDVLKAMGGFEIPAEPATRLVASKVKTLASNSLIP